MKRKSIIALLLLVAVLVIGCSNSEGGTKQMNKHSERITGEQIANAMLEGKYDHLYEQFSEELQNIVSLKDFRAVSKQFLDGEQSFSLTSTSTLNGYEMLVWRNENHDKGIFAAVNEQGIIDGFQILPLTTYPETDQLQSEVIYQLPFTDEWYVFWGGKDVFSNYHYEYEHMRYAYDFVKVVDGYSYSGDPLKNESYYAFDQEVVAPAKGKVIKVIDGIEDNIPGQINEQQPEGNMIVIEHEHGEYSMLAHFKQNSIVVKEGDIVEAGQLLGRSGNSGNSSEAHIHYQVTKIGTDGQQFIVPITFSSGKEWVKGEFAHN